MSLMACGLSGAAALADRNDNAAAIGSDQAPPKAA
jgi:hypothetical protein